MMSTIYQGLLDNNVFKAWYKVAEQLAAWKSLTGFPDRFPLTANRQSMYPTCLGVLFCPGNACLIMTTQKKSVILPFSLSLSHKQRTLSQFNFN